MPISVAYFSTLVEEEGGESGGRGGGGCDHSRFLFSVRSIACQGVITLCKQGSLCRNKYMKTGKNLIFIIVEELTFKLMLVATWTI